MEADKENHVISQTIQKSKRTKKLSSRMDMANVKKGEHGCSTRKQLKKPKRK